MRAGRIPAFAILLVLCGSAACSSSDDTGRPSFGRAEPVALPLPPGADRAGVGSITWSGRAWWVAGSFHDDTGEHRPGLWTSADGLSWSRMDTEEITYYGGVSVLYSVAASDRGVVALGTATGGAHGNPRTVSWILGDDDVLREVRASFELYNGPRQISVRTVVDAPAGWVIIGSRVNQNGQIGAASWTSQNGNDFSIHDDDPELSSDVSEQQFGFDVTTVGNEVVAVGQHTSFSGHNDTDGAGWVSAAGVTWRAWHPDGLDAGGAGAQRMHRVGSSGDRLVIAGTETIDDSVSIVAWTSVDGLTWRRERIDVLGASGDVLSAATTAVATRDEFIVGARLDGVLHLVVSDDGESWDEVAVSTDLPTTNRATLAAGSNGRNLLVGATSLDGGGLWRFVKAT